MKNEENDVNNCKINIEQVKINELVTRIRMTVAISKIITLMAQSGILECDTETPENIKNLEIIKKFSEIEGQV